MTKSTFVFALVALVSACTTDPSISDGGVGLYKGDVGKVSRMTEEQISKCWVKKHTLISDGIAYRRKDKPTATVFEVRRTAMFADEFDPFLTIIIFDGSESSLPPGDDHILSINVSETRFAPNRMLHLSRDVWRWAAGNRDCQVSTKTRHQTAKSGAEQNTR